MAVAFAFGAGLEVSKELERRDGWEVDKSRTIYNPGCYIGTKG